MIFSEVKKALINGIVKFTINDDGVIWECTGTNNLDYLELCNAKPNDLTPNENSLQFYDINERNFITVYENEFKEVLHVYKLIKTI